MRPPKPVPQFGVQEPDREYLSRPGAYAILPSEKGLLAVVKTPNGIYLPGGGIEAQETPQIALEREVSEECGIRVRAGAYLGQADEYVHSPVYKKHFVKHSHFYLANIVGKSEAIEDDHELLWLGIDEARDKLRDGSHRWAISRFLELASGRSGR